MEHMSIPEKDSDLSPQKYAMYQIQYEKLIASKVADWSCSFTSSVNEKSPHGGS